MTLAVPLDQKKPLVWYDINATSFFDMYRIEGVDPQNSDENQIYFEISSNQLMPALGGIKKAVTFVEIKLGKKEFPYLIVNMRVPSAIDQDKNVTITNQVPVIIIPRVGWDDFNVPYGTGDFNVQAKCPRFSIFKRYVDTFKFVNKIKIIVRRDRTLTIEATQDSTRLFTIFRDIDACEYGSSDPYEGRTVSAAIEQKKISFWLHSVLFAPPFRLDCMIEDNKKLKLFIRIRDDILAHFVIAAEIEEVDSDVENVEVSDVE